MIEIFVQIHEFFFFFKENTSYNTPNCTNIYPHVKIVLKT